MSMDWNLKRRARERRIAAEVVDEVYAALKSALDSGADAQILINEKRELVARIFALACERHQLTNEAAASRVFAYLVPVLADLHRRLEKIPLLIQP